MSQKAACNATPGQGGSELSMAAGDARRTVKRWAQHPRGASVPQTQCRGQRIKAECDMESHCPADLEGHFKQRTEWATLNRERLSFLSPDSSELSRMQKVLA